MIDPVTPTLTEATIDITPDEAWMCTLVSLRKVEIDSEELHRLEETMLAAIDAVMAQRDALRDSINLFKVSAAHDQRVAGLPSIPSISQAADLERSAEARKVDAQRARWEGRFAAYEPASQSYVACYDSREPPFGVANAVLIR